MRIAIHDLGSHTFHLLCARLGPDGVLVRETSKKHVVRLGADSLASGQIPEDGWQRGLAALDDLAVIARAFEGETYAVGTSVLRDTRNGSAFAEAAAGRLGVPVHVLSGREEAELVYLGALSALRGDTGTIAVLDLGGGSLEIAVGDRRGTQYLHSLALGTLRLRDLDHATIAAQVSELGRGVWDEVRRLAPSAIVLTGGSARLLAKLDGRPRLDSEGLLSLARLLASVPEPARLAMGVPTARVDTVAPAAAILGAVLAELGGVAEVSPRGLREGFIVRMRQSRGAYRPSSDSIS